MAPVSTRDQNSRHVEAQMPFNPPEEIPPQEPSQSKPPPQHQDEQSSQKKSSEQLRARQKVLVLKRDVLPEQDLDKGIVGWEGQDDLENPRNYTSMRKWTILFLVSSMTLISPFASSVFAPAVRFADVEFHNNSTLLSTFVVSAYVLGYAIGPLFLSPLSEIYGRRIILNIASLHFTVWQIGCALAPNISSLIVFRLLTGMGGSACLTIGGGTIADLFEKEQRGLAMSIFTAGPLFGPVLGPICGGFIAQGPGWRWVFWTLLIVAGACTSLILIFYRETNHTVLIREKTRRLAKELKRSDLISCYDKTQGQRSAGTLLVRSLIRPAKMLFMSPIVGLLAIYVALIYGCLYLLFTTVTDVFQRTYLWSPDLTGLAYIGLGLGLLCGQALFGLSSDRIIIRLTHANDGVYQPEMRLTMCLLYAFFVPISFFWYGWSIQAKVHWIVPIIGLLPFGFGMIGIFTSIQTYIIDSYSRYAASGIASVTVTRSFFGAFLPLAGPSLYQQLGYGWGNSMLGFITLALIPAPVLLRQYGGVLRERFPAEPSHRKRKCLRTAEHVEALKARIEALESCIKNLTRPAHLNGILPASECQLPGRSSIDHPSDCSTEHPDNDISWVTPKFVLTRHATEEAEDSFQGYSGDRAFIQRMREDIKNWPGDNVRSRIRPPSRPVAKLFDCDYSPAVTVCLPSKAKARALVDAALESYSLFPILHRPSFDRCFDDIYALGSDESTAEELRFLPLLYAVLALGCIFIQKDTGQSSRELEITEGLQYFAASRAFIDLGDCTDEISLQTMTFLILFTIGNARAGTCYSYVTHALTLALRMGLHRSKSKYDDLIEREVSKRIFWVLRLLGNYFATACGMPRLLNDENVDQDLPVEVNDAYITKESISPQPPEEVCTIAGLNTIIALHKILDQVVRDIYPPRGVGKIPGSQATTYLVSIEKIKDIERALKGWTENLPFGFRLKSHSTSRSLLRTQYLLCMSHAHVQLYLYRPFIHYLSKPLAQSTSSSNITFSPYAAACVRACHTILNLSGELYKNDLLQGGNFTVLHMVFGSVVTLMFIVLDSADWEGRELAFKDISIGRKAIAFLANGNDAAERAQTILETMIALLPAEFAETRERLEHQRLGATDLAVADSGEADSSLMPVGLDGQDLGEVPVGQMGPIFHVEAQFDHPTTSTSHSFEKSQQIEASTSKCLPSTTLSPDVPNTSTMSRARAEDSTVSAPVHQEPGGWRVQRRLSPQPAVPFIFQGGGAEPRMMPPPYGDPTTEFLEAQPFDFSTNYLGDVWSGMNQFPGPIISDQAINGLQMMDVPNLMGLHQYGSLFNFDYLP
ncbi:uncharacterized protein Z519_01169 [Cladophialophora bantiana CBS 173.52]|uniref:Major facilitator superfamily (MFS) profile domain-containing protein n=1 Tax=Cladophialophora bantiana (strain ATCC 10958 / CBS 173.52 / CDC B-1940 / NIH 8579) TaxID=1442370 RepID=A0A0D2I328_CLAB1|nr:uncharacterized protein Z519_01169 [Cladophialophora bantiana CBS 173.52]KIW97585.1 hypothetical protein Z519_01169 [Cladophialophora bantiana CBS 173.52]